MTIWRRKVPSFLPADTTLDAARVQFEVLRRIGPEGRFRRMVELSDNLQAVAAAGVRNRHPEYSDETVRLAVARLKLGDELFRKAFPRVTVEP